jgi:hypothetical protein
MASGELNKILRIIAGLLLGLISGLIVFILFLGFFFFIGLFGWSDGGDPAYLKRLEQTTNITLIISLLFGLLVTFLISRLIINKKNRINY